MPDILPPIIPPAARLLTAGGAGVGSAIELAGAGNGTVVGTALVTGAPVAAGAGLSIAAGASVAGGAAVIAAYGVNAQHAWRKVDNDIEASSHGQELKTTAEGEKPSFYKFQNLPLALAEVSPDMKDVNIKRLSSGRFDPAAQRQLDMTDPATLLQFEKALDNRIAAEKKIEADNHSPLPEALRWFGKDSLQKEKAAEIDLATLNAAKEELAKFKEQAAVYQRPSSTAPGQEGNQHGKPPAGHQAEKENHHTDAPAANKYADPQVQQHARDLEKSDPAQLKTEMAQLKTQVDANPADRVSAAALQNLIVGAGGDVGKHGVDGIFKVDSNLGYQQVTTKLDADIARNAALAQATAPPSVASSDGQTAAPAASGTEDGQTGEIADPDGNDDKKGAGGYGGVDENARPRYGANGSGLQYDGAAGATPAVLALQHFQQYQRDTSIFNTPLASVMPDAKFKGPDKQGKDDKDHGQAYLQYLSPDGKSLFGARYGLDKNGQVTLRAVYDLNNPTERGTFITDMGLATDEQRKHNGGHHNFSFEVAGGVGGRPGAPGGVAFAGGFGGGQPGMPPGGGMPIGGMPPGGPFGGPYPAGPDGYRQPRGYTFGPEGNPIPLPTYGAPGAGAFYAKHGYLPEGGGMGCWRPGECGQHFGRAACGNYGRQPGMMADASFNIRGTSINIGAALGGLLGGRQQERREPFERPPPRRGGPFG